MNKKMFSEKFKDFLKEELKEIQENKLRVTGLCICFVLAVILFLTDDSGGEEIILTETPAPIETAENVDAGKKIIAVQNSTVPNFNENIKIVLGANSDDLFIHDPFKIPPKEIVKPAEVPAVKIAPPVAQVTEKFILRGTAIIGNSKTALIQKISANDKSEENLILVIGDNINGKKIVEIATDCVILEGGEILFLDIQN